MKSNDCNSWSVGLNVSAPLSTKPRKDALLPYAVAIREAEYKCASLKKQIRQELQSLLNKIALTCKQYESAHSNIALAGMNMKEAQELLDNRFISLEEFFKSKKNFETSSMQIFKSKCEYTINFYKFEQAKGTLLDAFGVNQISAN